MVVQLPAWMVAQIAANCCNFRDQRNKGSLPRGFNPQTSPHPRLRELPSA